MQFQVKELYLLSTVAVLALMNLVNYTVNMLMVQSIDRQQNLFLDVYCERGIVIVYIIIYTFVEVKFGSSSRPGNQLVPFSQRGWHQIFFPTKSGH